jgi:hypothetical protein
LNKVDREAQTARGQSGDHLQDGEELVDGVHPGAARRPELVVPRAVENVLETRGEARERSLQLLQRLPGPETV